MNTELMTEVAEALDKCAADNEQEAAAVAEELADLAMRVRTAIHTAEETVSIDFVAADIKSVRPGWSDERCEDEYKKIRRHLRDRLIEVGYEILAQVLPETLT